MGRLSLAALREEAESALSEITHDDVDRFERELNDEPLDNDSPFELEVE